MIKYKEYCVHVCGAGGNDIGWITALQARKLRVRLFAGGVLGFFIDVILLVSLWDLWPTQLLKQKSASNISWRYIRTVRGLTALSHSCTEFFWILGVLVSWNPQRLSRPLHGLHYLYIPLSIYCIIYIYCTSIYFIIYIALSICCTSIHFIIYIASSICCIIYIFHYLYIALPIQCIIYILHYLYIALSIYGIIYILHTYILHYLYIRVFL